MDETECDMGPFAGMDPALVRAVAGYGTPPYRGIVTVAVRDVDSYRFNKLPTTIDGWLVWLEAARAAAPEEYRASLRCVLRDEDDWEGGGPTDLTVTYERAETDEEMTARVSRGLAYVREREERERQEFERLSAKFKP